MPRQPVTLPEKIEPRSDSIILERQYKLITPLYGGGYKAGENDITLLIRPTSIRGHLRFWWRAARGSNQHVHATLERLGLDTTGSDIEKLKRLEGWIWGAAASKRKNDESKEQRIAQSRVLLQILQIQEGQRFQPHDGLDIGDVRSEYSYVAFPLRGLETSLQQNVTFTLKISISSNHIDIEPEVNAALWAWTHFGGIGARTRRGFGAISEVLQKRNEQKEDVEFAPLQNTQEWLFASCQRHIKAGTWPTDVPHLSPTPEDYRIAGQPQDSIQVWRNLFNQLKVFRQQRKLVNRTLTNGRQRPMPGRNWWPEPDTIRLWTGKAANFVDAQNNTRDHTRPHYTPPLLSFPRAQFGLPIQFEFKDRNTPNGTRDPSGKNLLSGLAIRRNGIVKDKRVIERFASPLIMRPIACADGGFLGLAIQLQGTQLPPLEIELEGVGMHEVSASLTPEDAARILDRDGNQLLVRQNITSTNVISAFLKFL
jgi:CRISPR-associated protein Cmr1